MAKVIKVNIDKSEKWLDRQRTMTDNDGWKQQIDSFIIMGITGYYANIQFRKVCDVVFSEKENRRIYKTIGMFEKRKKVKYADNGDMIINISGYDYIIGTYENAR